MSLKLPYIAPNKWYHHLYNSYCLKQLLTKRQLYTDETETSKEKPLFITGFFRSGTSLTAHLLNTLGMDLGPTQHLLQAKNERAILNPDGFYENYIFMETSLYIFHKLKSWGHLPPTPKQVQQMTLDKLDRNHFAEFSLCGVHDDRISNKNKVEALTHFDLLSLNSYFEKKFKYPYAVKNPHFSVLSPFLIKKWPEAKFLICFREPASAIESAAKITPLLNEKVYERYYSELIQLPSDKVFFFSHAELMQSPENSILKLCETFNLNKTKIKEALAILNPALHRHQSKEVAKNKTVQELYELMLSKAINK